MPPPPSPSSAPAPDPDILFPVGGTRSVVFLRPLLARRAAGEGGPVEVGAYSYYSDFDDPTRFFERNVRYHFPFSTERLTIGRFCAIAHGATILMASGNHAQAGPSTYPFPIMGGAWAEAQPLESMPFPDPADTVIGHDVWLGHESLILPGVTIGSGAIVAARAVVSQDVPPYAVVAGNPARLVRRRFDPAQVEDLLALAWWDWPVEAITAAIPALVAGDVATLTKGI
jgi:virginiamycin A acetyltransferase